MDLDLAFHLAAVTGDVRPESLPGILERLRGLGYRRAVLPPLDVVSADAAAYARVFSSAGIAPIMMCGQGLGADVSSADADEREAGATALRAAVDFAARAGADQLNGVPYGLFGHPTEPLSRERFEASAREVGAVAEDAAAQGVQLTFEVLNRYEEAAINTAEQAIDYVAASGSANLGIHLDTFHMAIEERDMAAAIRAALPYLKYLELGQSGRGPLGEGAVDVPGVVCRALDDGYAGRLGVEAFSRPLAGEAADGLSIWRDTYDDGLVVAADAVTVIRRGWAESMPGRRAQRLSRTAG